MEDKLQITAMRLSTCAEWDVLMEATGGDNNIMHWKDVFSWCQDANPDCTSSRAVRGYYLARLLSFSYATYRNVLVGFRPAFETLNPDSLDADGTIVTIGTLYMDGQPVKVPQNPVCDGDIPDYIPGAKLELREALDDPAYQVQAIKVGDILIADRVLLKRISWNDLAAQEFTKEDFTTTKEDENMNIIAFTDAEYGSFAIACSLENREKVRGFIEKRYPKWVAACKDMVGVCPGNHVMDAVRDMRELLGDEKLEFISGYSVVELPRQD